MTLRTATYDDTKFKIVPIEATEEMIKSVLGDASFFSSEYVSILKRKYKDLVESAPEYKESE
jgi:hypothetical protein